MIKINILIPFIASILLITSGCKQEEEMLTWADLAVNDYTFELTFKGNDPYKGNLVDTTYYFDNKSLTNTKYAYTSVYNDGNDTCIVFSVGKTKFDAFIMKISKTNLQDFIVIGFLPVREGSILRLIKLESSMVQNVTLDFTSWNLENQHISGSMSFDVEKNGYQSSVNCIFDMPAKWTENPYVQ